MKTNDEFKNPYAISTQKGRIIKHLMSGRKLTQLEALQRFGCLRLSGRIFELIEYGYLIECELHRTPTGKRVGRYFISKENREKLKSVVSAIKI